MVCARRNGLPARTRTWNHRLGGGSYILFNYREPGTVYRKVEGEAAPDDPSLLRAMSWIRSL